MTKRDQELDEVLNGLRADEAPYIERPDEQMAPSGLLCWLDGTRACGPDCVAFNIDEIDARGNALLGANRCLPLVYMGQQGAGALSQIAVNRAAIKHAQDQARQQEPRIPDPRGGV